MSLPSFTLSPEAVFRLYDVILCMAKFSEIVALDALPDKLVLSALNLNQSAYAAFSFDKSSFFTMYHLAPTIDHLQSSARDGSQRFTCQLYNKALLSVFKGQLRDYRDQKSGLERCECRIQESPDEAQCRLIIRMVCRHGMIKIYKLTYEAVDIKRAVFDKSVAQNVWKISSLTLKSFAEYFGANTDQLKISTEGGKTVFTSYTEKVMKGKEILRRPMQTSISIDNLDFERFEVEEGSQLGIVLKDFKSITTHAESMKATVIAHFSDSGKPMQFRYLEGGILSEFTLMTIGGNQRPSTTPVASETTRTAMAPPPRPPQQRSAVRQASTSRNSAAENNTSLGSQSEHNERARHTAPANGSQRPSPPPPKASLDPESLFFPQYDDEDRQWGERDLNEEEDAVGWSATAGSHQRAYNTSYLQPTSRPEPHHPADGEVRDVLEPTQRLSDVEDPFAIGID